MYMNHPANKRDERSEEKQRNIEVYKKGSFQHTRYFEK